MIYRLLVHYLSAVANSRVDIFDEEQIDHFHMILTDSVVNTKFNYWRKMMPPIKKVTNAEASKNIL